MDNGDLQEQIEASNGYEALLVPALFQQWTTKVLDAAQLQGTENVLDVACGTGILARESIRRTSGLVAGVDPGIGMLAVAERLEPTVEWRQGTAEALPYPDASFDVVVSQFGLMFFADRHKALQEMLRVLTPQGCLAVAVWDSLEHNLAYATEVALLDRGAGKAAGDALHAPFILGDQTDLMTLFNEAGVSSVSVATHTGTGRFPSVRTMVEADLRGWLPLMDVVLDEAQIQYILAETEKDLKAYITTEGTAEFDVSAHIITGSKP